MSLWRRPAYQTKFKASDINVTAWVASGALKALPVLSDTTVRRSAVEQENLKPYKKSEKRPHISWSEQQPYYLQVFQKISIAGRRVTGWTKMFESSGSQIYWNQLWNTIRNRRLRGIKVGYDLFKCRWSCVNIMLF